VSRLLAAACALLLVAAPVAAQTQGEEAPAEADPPAETDPPSEGEVPVLPAPTLEEEEPIAPPEPLPPEPEEEEGQPQILEHIGPGDHPEWEDGEDGDVPRDYAFEVPGDQRSNVTQPGNPQAPQFPSVDEEQEVGPFHLGVGGGWARLLAGIPLDFFRAEERFEAMVPDFETLRLGAAAWQMVAEDRFVVGGGVRIGLGVRICDGAGVICEGSVFFQPGFAAGLTGPRFDLHAGLSLRLILGQLGLLSIDGGYSLLIEGNSIVHLGGTAGLVF